MGVFNFFILILFDTAQNGQLRAQPSRVLFARPPVLYDPIWLRFTFDFQEVSVGVRRFDGVCQCLWHMIPPALCKESGFRLLLAATISHRLAARDLHKTETCDLLGKFALEKLIVRVATCLALSDVFWLIVRWRFELELCHSRILSLIEWKRTICLPRSRLCERESAVGTEEFQCQLMQRTFSLYSRNKCERLWEFIESIILR